MERPGRHPGTLSPTRTAIARRMVYCQQQVPHFHAQRDVEHVPDGLRDLAVRARQGRLKGPELTDGTCTLSNLGMYDVSQFTALVTPPQIAVVAIGRGEERTVVRDGHPEVRRSLHATNSADHRAVDGADAARFLGTFKTLLEAPGAWVDGGPHEGTTDEAEGGA